jgi:hypothetical protein
MSTRRRWVRVLRATALTVFALLAALFAFVQIQQHLLRWRAERLLADIRQIQMGKSTWADAQRLMYRWGKWNASWDSLECSMRSCNYAISLDDVSHALHRFPLIDGGQWGSELRWPRWMNRPYGWAGGRFAVVRAEFEVRNGIIWSKSFAVLLTPFPETYNETGELNALTNSSMMAQAVCETQCSHGRFHSKETVFSVDNPEMSLFAADDDRVGHGVMAEFTPFADGNTLKALLDFNLDCLSRWKQCCTVAELMPSAVSFYKTSVGKMSGGEDVDALKGLPLWIAARDAQYVAIAEVLRTRSGTPPNEHSTKTSFLIKKLLKGESDIPGRSSYMVKTVGSEETCPASQADARGFHRGGEILLVFSGQINEESTPEIELSPCVVAPITDENLAAIQRGIARDSVLRYPVVPQD